MQATYERLGSIYVPQSRTEVHHCMLRTIIPSKVKEQMRLLKDPELILPSQTPAAGLFRSTTLTRKLWTLSWKGNLQTASFTGPQVLGNASGQANTASSWSPSEKVLVHVPQSCRRCCTQPASWERKAAGTFLTHIFRCAFLELPHWNTPL